jgi:chaperonin GroES
MIKPIKDKLVVRLKEREEVSRGGIHIPEAAQSAEEWGVVEAKGSDVKDLEVGDVVYIRSVSGTHYVEKRTDYVIIEEAKVICKIIDERP